MRAIWTGAVAFGLVNVPVKAYGAIEDHDVQLHQVHDADGGRIRYQRRCEVCGEKVEYSNIQKAYDDGERTVVLTGDDFDSLPAEKSREIEVVQFVPNGQIDPIMLERSYYLEPDSKSPKAYLLLRKTLEDTELTAIVKFALRQKTRLGALRVRGKVLVLQAMLWGDEVREVDFPATKSRAKISDQELKMSAMLVEQFAGDFSPLEYEDEYQKELRLLIEEKLKRGDSLDTDATFGDAEAAKEESGEGSGDVIDLMEALKRSIEGKRSKSKSKPGAKSTSQSSPQSREKTARKKGA
ncbi:Ku protein [Arthrobacter sp. KK5.5]|uniref:non-homologous end joining protein Ku n=1 Tax=Arthrobacter sp. KK5.5 TaxID=3373084 RepID=UPI003EE661DF